MNSLRRLGETAVMLTAGWASLATSGYEPTPAGLSNGRWVYSNVFDGQTGVPRDIALELRIGLRDFRSTGGGDKPADVQARAAQAMQALSLRELEGATQLKFDCDILEEFTIVRPIEPLRENSRYQLLAAPVVAAVRPRRSPPPPIEFTTRPGPQVTGVWLVEDTLMITFSEPIAKGALGIAADSVDLFWETRTEFESASADRNLATLVWDNEGMLFRVAPIADPKELWVKVSRNVAAESGAPLDGDKDGIAGELEDDYLQRVNLSKLPSCVASEDRPEPCIPVR